MYLHITLNCVELWYKQNSDLNVVVSVRFQNKVDFLKRLGGTIIKITRPTNVTDTHSSETELETIQKFDLLIDNSGERSDIFEKIKNIKVLHA